MSNPTDEQSRADRSRANPTEQSRSNPTDDVEQPRAFSPGRRSVMKTIGAGTVIGALGGTAAAGGVAADEHEPDDEEPDVDESSSDDEAPERGTVHVVTTQITQSTNPERPADFFYQPTGIHIDPGDVIKFVFETPDHNVTAYHPAFGMQRRLPPGVQPFSSPIMGWDPHSLPADIDDPPMEGDAGDEEGGGDDPEAGSPEPSSWLHAFETPGVYDLECAPHEAFGMAMRVVVGDETDTAFELSNPDELPPPRAGPVGFSRQVLTDPELDPARIVEEGAIRWMDLEVNQPTDAGESEE